MARRSERELIRSLQARGWTQRQIAKAVGRSPSYISKIAVGKKSGRGLGKSLRTISRRKRPSTKPALAERLAGYRKPPVTQAPPGPPLGGGGGAGGGAIGGRDLEVGIWYDNAGGKHDGKSWTDPFDVARVVVNIPGHGWRTFPVFFTEDYDWESFVEDVEDLYG